MFDGSVWWVPKLEGGLSIDGLHDKIEAGQAKEYTRSKPGVGKLIPFGRRQFVRRIEQAVRTNTEGEIIAYDGLIRLLAEFVAAAVDSVGQEVGFPVRSGAAKQRR